MADEKKKQAAPKTTAKAKKEAPAAKAAAPAKAYDGPPCKADKCKQPVRAKGYCRKHYFAWKRGKIGTKQRYKICSKEGCRKPAVLRGRCEEHKKGGAAGGEAAPAAA
jgi:hypothetical protein